MFVRYLDFIEFENFMKENNVEWVKYAKNIRAMKK
jgi:hypothetical protein